MDMKLHDGSFTLILRGEKTNTIREGHRNIPFGIMRFEATHNTVPSIVVDVVGVGHCKFRDLTWVNLKDSGVFDVDHNLSLDENLQNFLTHMQKIYPHMTMDSDITIIDFNYPA
jgi:hypothetical protein